MSSNREFDFGFSYPESENANLDYEALHGTWTKDGIKVATISGSREDGISIVLHPEELHTTISHTRRHEYSLRLGEDTVSAVLHPMDGKLVWSDGIVWHPKEHIKCPCNHRLVDYSITGPSASDYLVQAGAKACAECREVASVGQHVMACMECNWWLCDMCAKHEEDERKHSIKLLKSVDLFQHLRKTEIIQVLDIMKLKELNEGDVIFVKGDIGNALFVVDIGLVSAVGDDVATISPGRSFGEAALLNAPHGYSAVATCTPTIIGCIDTFKLKNMVDLEAMVDIVEAREEPMRHFAETDMFGWLLCCVADRKAQSIAAEDRGNFGAPQVSPRSPRSPRQVAPHAAHLHNGMIAQPCP
jgi:hypothetical protein